MVETLMPVDQLYLYVTHMHIILYKLFYTYIYSVFRYIHAGKTIMDGVASGSG